MTFTGQQFDKIGQSVSKKNQTIF